MLELFNNFIRETSAGFIHLDHLLFAKINQEWTSYYLDSFMTFITSFHNTIYLLILIAIMFVIRQKMKAVKILLGIALTIGFSDSFATRIVKPLVHRQRPEFVMKNTRLLVPSQKTFGFPSNHATNCFAVATFLGTVIPEARSIAWIVAFLVAYSRVYVGVHFPLDVLFGALFGIFWGVIVFKFLGNQVHSQKVQWRNKVVKRRGPRFGRR